MNDFWRRLLYRWFVQYNPLYLVSAMMVLGGTILTSRGLSSEGSLYGPLGVAAIAEVYALALIGGAAFLTRIGQQRPAVMLALLTALYQCDLTLHTETCVQLGVAGACAAGAWLALFALKLFALGWAMRVRISIGAFATAALGAAGLVVGPYVVELASYASGGAFIAAWLFILGLVAPTAWVTSTAALDDWGQKVLARSLRAIWLIWGTLLSLHVLFWASGHNVALVAVIPASALVVARYARSEGAAWAMIVGTVALGGLVAPASVSLLALLAAVALVCRAYSKVYVVGEIIGQDAPGPYRMGEQVFQKRYAPILTPLDAAEKARHLTGALLSFYLSMWTMGFRGGAWPAHSIVVDLIVFALAVGLALRLKRWTSIAVPAFGGAHAIILSGVIPTPQTTLGWGSAALILGFALLLGGLAASYRFRRFTAPSP